MWRVRTLKIPNPLRSRRRRLHETAYKDHSTEPEPSQAELIEHYLGECWIIAPMAS